MTLQSAEPVHHDDTAKNLSKDMPIMSTSSALMPGQVDASGDIIEQQAKPPEPPRDRSKSPTRIPPLPKVTGWERNEQNKLISRTVDLATYLDPSRLADQAVDLNLKLIKWRISPSIDLDTIKHTKCLLLGAGTLGSYVARGLMGWGVRKITFVDNATVSYSNPVRQPLFNFEDCQGGGKRKAIRAAEALKEVYPGVESEGHVMSVPMIGHPVTDVAKTQAEYEKLRELIIDADVVVQGYRPGVLDKYGFGQQGIIDMCRDRKRGIISVRENCYGWHGPWAHRSGWQQISDAVSRYPEISPWNGTY